MKIHSMNRYGLPTDVVSQEIEAKVLCTTAENLAAADFTNPIAIGFVPGSKMIQVMVSDYDIISKSKIKDPKSLRRRLSFNNEITIRVKVHPYMDLRDLQGTLLTATGQVADVKFFGYMELTKVFEPKLEEFISYKEHRSANRIEEVIEDDSDEI